MYDAVEDSYTYEGSYRSMNYPLPGSVTVGRAMVSAPCRQNGLLNFHCKTVAIYDRQMG